MIFGKLDSPQPFLGKCAKIVDLNIAVAVSIHSVAPVVCSVAVCPQPLCSEIGKICEIHGNTLVD
jgi:hypothetical protein